MFEEKKFFFLKKIFLSEFQDETTVKDTYNDSNYSIITKIVLPNMMNSINLTRLSGSQGRKN